MLFSCVKNDGAHGIIKIPKGEETNRDKSDRNHQSKGWRW